ncbi:MAG: thrombospondin type 3 repeat-containing protein [bacterium]|nr:thrombospondin type 3 repeat-containing protein [bacterium]
MKKSHLTILMMLCWVLLLVPMSVSAQAGPGDQDGDGVSDSVDACPTVAGLTVYMGCPDTDGDSIPDNVDACPTQAGVAAFAGCLDSDGDSIPDNVDSCPTQVGVATFAGCPDSDGDGTSDNLDGCPTVGGPDSNRGCPVDQQPPPPDTTIPSDSSSTNPIRPVPGGACQLATFLTAAVNIREYPAPDAPVVGTLDPAVLYNVYGVVLVGTESWYAVDGGWVSSIAVVLGGDCGGLVRLSSQEVVLNELPQRPTHGIVPEQECVEVAGLAVPFCYMVLTAYADDDRDPSTEGLQPETECVAVAGLAVPFCYLKLVAYADDGTGATSGLQPETKCVDILGTNFCYLDLVAYAPDNDGATNGLQPETKCVDLQGQNVCYMELVAYPEDDGATGGISPETKCVDVATVNFLVCYTVLTARPNDDSTAGGLQPETKCVDIATQTVPFCYLDLVAYPNDDDGATGGLSPETECVEIATVAVPFCYLVLTASVDDDGATSGLVPETECVDLVGQLVCYMKLTAYAPDDDGATGGISPENRCVQLAGSSEYFCYTILVGRLPDDSNAVPVNTGDGGVAGVFDPNTAPTCDQVREEIFAMHSTEWRREGSYAVQYLIVNPDVPLPEPRPCVQQTSGGIVSEGQGYGFTSASTTTQTREHILLARQVGYASFPPNGWGAFDLTDGEEPVQALLLPAVQKVREAANRSLAADFFDDVRNGRIAKGATVVIRIDFFEQSATDSSGNTFHRLFGDVDGSLAATDYLLELDGIKGESK